MVGSTRVACGFVTQGGRIRHVVWPVDSSRSILEVIVTTIKRCATRPRTAAPPLAADALKDSPPLFRRRARSDAIVLHRHGTATRSCAWGATLTATVHGRGTKTNRTGRAVCTAIKKKAYAEAMASAKAAAEEAAADAAQAAPECSGGHASPTRTTERLPARPTSKEGEADDFQFEEAHGQEILEAGIFWTDESGEQQRYRRCLTTNCSNGSYHKLPFECDQCRLQHSGILDRKMEHDF